MNLSRSKIFLLCLLAFIAGVGTASLAAIEFVYLYGGLLLATAILVVFWRQRAYRLAALWMLFFVLGAMRFTASLPRADNPADISYYNGQKVTVAGVVVAEPDARLDSQRLTMEARTTPGPSLQRRGLKGRLLVKTNLYPQYQYGDLLKVSCQLEAPGQIEDFAYDKYLARYDIYSVCRYAQIEKIDSGHGNPVMAAILKIKSRFVAGINQALPEPHAALMSGILIGARRGIPQNLLDDFSRVGVTHIIAISGSNITIIAAALLAILSVAGLGRQLSFWLLSASILLFVIATGASASVVRAAIMAILVLLARRLGRASRAGNALVLAAFTMLVINPKILVFDLGFQLSFLATVGLVYLDPLITAYLKNWPEVFGLKQALTATLAAIIMTTPLVLYQFGRLSLIAPLANLAIVPLVPLTMLAGFVTGIVGMVWPPLGQIGGYASWLLLEYIIRVAEFFSGLPLASWEWGGFHWMLALAIYGAIGWGILKVTSFKLQVTRPRYSKRPLVTRNF